MGGTCPALIHRRDPSPHGDTRPDTADPVVPLTLEQLVQVGDGRLSHGILSPIPRWSHLSPPPMHSVSQMKIPPWRSEPDWPSSAPTMPQFWCLEPWLSRAWPFTEQRWRLVGSASLRPQLSPAVSQARLGHAVRGALEEQRGWTPEPGWGTSHVTKNTEATQKALSFEVQPCLEGER